MKRTLAASVIGIGFYIIMVEAALMAWISLLGRPVGQCQTGINSLAAFERLAARRPAQKCWRCRVITCLEPT